MNRRYFLMSSAAVANAVRASAMASPNDTVRVACVGFNGRGVAHLRAYPRIPNTEIVALCDVDEAVLDKGVKMVEAATKKRPTAYTDLRKLLEDKSIDAISIATPNTSTRCKPREHFRCSRFHGRQNPGWQPDYRARQPTSLPLPRGYPQRRHIFRENSRII